MTVSTRRVWRASSLTLALVWAFAGVAALGIPTLAYLLHQHRGTVALPAILVLLALATVTYAWRYGLHPRVQATDDALEVHNPWRTHRVRWPDITLIVPGENGLLIGTEDLLVEAWCVQKSRHATERMRRTRADRVASELLDLLELQQPPLQDGDGALLIRRARPDESRLLTRMERSASEAELSGVFPPESYPYPTAEVTRRWRRLLRDRLVTIKVLEVDGEPAGYLAYDGSTIRHLGVRPGHTRHGYGSWLLEVATSDLFERGVPAARLWVLTENHTARRFYAVRGWLESGQRRTCEYPPFPEEIELVKGNPLPPRRAVRDQEQAPGGPGAGRQHLR